MENPNATQPSADSVAASIRAGPGRLGDAQRHERQVAALARADGKPTLADAEKDVRIIEAAKRLVDEWCARSIDHAIAKAKNRVRGARRRAGHEHPD